MKYRTLSSRDAITATAQAIFWTIFWVYSSFSQRMRY